VVIKVVKASVEAAAAAAVHSEVCNPASVDDIIVLISRFPRLLESSGKSWIFS